MAWVRKTSEASGQPKPPIVCLLTSTSIAATGLPLSLPDQNMQYVSSLGGPRVMLPTSEIGLWIDKLGESPSPDEGLYGLACSINEYCGIISPWGTPLLIFGDLPSDIIYVPGQYDGLLVRWVGADSLERLAAFATAEASADAWDETKEIEIVDKDMTIMDTCTYHDDDASRIQLAMRIGTYRLCSRYAESSDVMAIIHRLEYIG